MKFHERIPMCALLLLAGGCGEAGELPKDQPVAEVSQASVCGTTWDLQDVELYDGSDPDYDQAFVAKYEGAFGKDCSGTLIGSDLFLTVAHDGCSVTVGESVYFGCQVSASNPNPADPVQAALDNCESYSAIQSWNYTGGYDVSVARLDGKPGLKYGWVVPARRTPSVNERLAMFQHPLEFGRRKMVGFGPVIGVDGKDVEYTIDTSGGSSGAGVLDQLGFLVAVHRRGGCGGSSGNTGTSMEFIIDEIPEVRSPVVAMWLAAL